MARVILDSSVLIALFNDFDAHHQNVIKAIGEEANNQYFISAITFSESLVHAFRNKEAEKVKENILRAVDGVIDVDTEIAEIAASMRALKKSISAPDAFISASAQAGGLTLWTTDRALAGVTPGSRLI
jgi:predicted nucleic acid-binding protein